MAGRLSSRQYPDQYPNGYDTFIWDSANNLKSHDDGRNYTTYYTYGDADGLLSQISFTHDPSVQLAYDSFDRPTSATDSTGSTSVPSGGYDDLDDVKTVTRVLTGVTTQSLNYYYNPDQTRQALGTSIGTITYGYLSTGLCNSVTLSGMGTASWQYDADDRVQTRTLPCGAYTTTSYNAVGLPYANLTAGVVQYAPDNTQTEFDSAFNYKHIATNTGLFFAGTTTYAHDQLDRLTSETSTRNGSYAYTNAFDNAGNPTTLRNQNASGTPPFNAANQPLASSYVFDKSGNPTTYAGLNPLVYNDSSRATQIGSNNFNTFGWDGLRASRILGATTTCYVYDGDQPILELNGSGAVTAINVFGPDGIVARQNSYDGLWNQYVFDLTGNCTVRLDPHGNMSASYMYDGFGLPAIQFGTSTTPDPWMYNAQSGYYTDWNLGYYLCGQRFYDPGHARWLNRDPISYAGGVNLYAYCGDGPLSSVDPSGLQDPVTQAIINEETQAATTEAETVATQTAEATAVAEASAGDLAAPIQECCEPMGLEPGGGDEPLNLAAGENDVLSGPTETENASSSSGETSYTRAGRLAHQLWDPGEGYQKEVELPSGSRVDALNRDTYDICEYKPNNLRAMMRGNAQVDRYIRELNEVRPRPDGLSWTGRVVPYN